MCGPRLLGLIGLLTGVYTLSRRAAQSLLSDVLGVALSLGTLSESEERVSEAVAAPVAEVREHAVAQTIKHVDATTWRQGNEPRTLWTIATSMVTFFSVTIDATREELRALFSQIRGILVSDRGRQFGFWAMVRRQICWAHLIRKFASFSERSGPAGELGKRLLLWTEFIFHAWHRVRDGTQSRREFREFMAIARVHVERLLEEGAGAGLRGVSGSCRDILDHRMALWTFVDVPGVEPTNNAAERALRAFVLWRKKSFGSQSERGTRFAERIMTVTHTLRKQKRDVLSYLTEACRAAIQNNPPPSLLPASP